MSRGKVLLQRKLDLQVCRSTLYVSDVASKGKDRRVFATCRTLAADWVASGGSSSCQAAEILLFDKSSCACPRHPPRHPALRNFAWKCLLGFLVTKRHRLCNRSARSPYFNGCCCCQLPLFVSGQNSQPVCLHPSRDVQFRRDSQRARAQCPSLRVQLRPPSL